MNSIISFSCLIIIVLTLGCSESEKLAYLDEMYLGEDSLVYYKDELKPYTGKSIGYYDNGNIEMEDFYIDGRLHGISKSYYPNGNIESKITYQNGALYDTAFYFYKSGEIETTIIFEEGGVKELLTNFNESSQIMAKGHTINGIENGKWYFYYPNGIKSSFEIYDNGILVDSTFSYFPDGKLRGKGYFKQGLKHGTFEYYDSITGDLIGSQTYQNDLLIESAVK